jgi:hypothetical protein
MPPVGRIVHRNSITAASLNQFVLVDIASLAQSWLNGSIPNHGVAIALTSVNGGFAFDSKESTGTAHQPELEVVLAGLSALPAAFTPVRLNGKATNPVATSGVSDPYIDNGTSLQINFNIDGAGSAAAINATSQFELGGVPVLGSSGSSSLFLGPAAGQSNTGGENVLLRPNGGQANTTANFATFVGSAAGLGNTTGDFNTLIGRQSGQLNTTGAPTTIL